MASIDLASLYKLAFHGTDVTDATAPTRRMSRISGQRSGASLKRARLRPESTYQPSTAVPAM